LISHWKRNRNFRVSFVLPVRPDHEDHKAKPADPEPEASQAIPEFLVNLADLALWVLQARKDFPAEAATLD